MRRSNLGWVRFCAIGLAVLAHSAMSDAQTPFFERSFDASQFVLGSNFGDGEQQTVDDFELSAPNVLTHVGWWGGMLNHPETQQTRTFQISLFADEAGTPSTTAFFEQWVEASVTETGEIGTNHNFGTTFHIYQYSADVLPVALDAGTPYWLSVLNADETLSQWVWHASAFEQGGSVYLRDGGTVQWHVHTETVRNAMSMSLVPEPALAFCVVAGAMGALIRRR